MYHKFYCENQKSKKEQNKIRRVAKYKWLKAMLAIFLSIYECRPFEQAIYIYMFVVRCTKNMLNSLLCTMQRYSRLCCRICFCCIYSCCCCLLSHSLSLSFLPSHMRCMCFFYILSSSLSRTIGCILPKNSFLLRIGILVNMRFYFFSCLRLKKE